MLFFSFIPHFLLPGAEYNSWLDSRFQLINGRCRNNFFYFYFFTLRQGQSGNSEDQFGRHRVIVRFDGLDPDRGMSLEKLLKRDNVYDFFEPRGQSRMSSTAAVLFFFIFYIFLKLSLCVAFAPRKKMIE